MLEHRPRDGATRDILGCDRRRAGEPVRVVVAGDAGPVSVTALGLASARIEERRPLGVPDVVTSNCIAAVYPVRGTIRTSSDLASVLGKVQSALAALQRATSIGARVSRERIIATIMLPEVSDIEWSCPHRIGHAETG